MAIRNFTSFEFETLFDFLQNSVPDIGLDIGKFSKDTIHFPKQNMDSVSILSEKTIFEVTNIFVCNIYMRIEKFISKAFL